MARIASYSALLLTFSPTTAWAHGDHSGIRGAVHVLTTADHLGLAFMALLLTGTVVHWLRGFRRDKSDDRADRA